MKTSKKFKFSQYLSLIIVAMMMLFPIYWIFVNSLKTVPGISEYPPQFIPRNPQWQNYVEVMKNPNIIIYMKNTLILIIGNTLGTLLSSSIVAYPLARMEFKGKSAIFGLILATMMVPTVITVIPQFLLFKQFGMLDSLAPMIIPSFFAFPYNVFLFRQFYLTIPKSLDESAKIDGCSSWQIFTKVIVPIAKPIFITVGVMSTVHWWNELFMPLIFIDSDALKTITLGALDSFTIQGTSGMIAWNLQMAFSIIISIPPIVLYFLASKHLTDGIKTTGIK